MRHPNQSLLDSITISFPEGTDFSQHPFSLNIIKNLTKINLSNQVTFFVGENGAGKSTLLEAIACHAGFGPEGGSKNFSFTTSGPNAHSPAQQLSKCLTLSWRRKTRDGYFFRAESFYNVASHLETVVPDALQFYGNKSLHAQSHGESFFSFFSNRLYPNGLYILDEPEAALSPQRQLSLLAIIHEVCRNSSAQFLIATHSPILLAYPHATIYSCDGECLATTSYTETQHYQITKRFLDNPEAYLRHLLAEEDESDD